MSNFDFTGYRKIVLKKVVKLPSFCTFARHLGTWHTGAGLHALETYEVPTFIVFYGLP